MSRPRLAALLVALLGAIGALGLPASASAAPRVVLAFLPAAGTQPGTTGPPQTILDILGARKQLAIGLSSSVQGSYNREQALLDITQGTRTSSAAYKPRIPETLTFFTDGEGGATMLAWPEILRRAASAPAEIHPGTLASLVPGGVGYAGVDGKEQVEAIAAADRAGHVAAVSIGLAADLPARIAALLQDHRVVVAGLPEGDKGVKAMDALIAARPKDELLIVQQAPPPTTAPQLLRTGIAGLGATSGLTSQTTHQNGLIAGIDLLPTIFRHLHLKVPKDVKGQPIEAKGPRNAKNLSDFSQRLRVIGSRRFPALETMLAIWFAVLLVAGVLADRRGVRWAMRVGGLAWCWVLTVLLITGALAPSKTSELALISLLSFGLGIATDALVRWPRAIFVPCAATVVAYSLDLARGSDLIVRSLLGPNPRFGSRFYGLGNELEASLPVLLFVALAVLLQGRGRSRQGAITFGVTGLVFGGIVGSGRLGADVGGVLTVGAGTAVAVLCMIPGALTKRRLALAVAAPAAALVALAVLDVVTGGDSHFTRTILQADGSQALWDVFKRRYELAFNVLKRGLMPFATGIALLACVYGVRYRRRIYASIGDDAAWQAAMYGSLAAGVAGTLFNDSGPLLLLFSTFVLAVVSAYVRGEPGLDDRAVGTGQDIHVPTRDAG
ncbi:hypothetical protein NBH00_05830 [Paraconexibacter antarcticus]|uniref:Uncharacterized protein n=1 Tax=Paraconexibacter antarcticus TaxID=2949664 RepID=A0ABY5DYP1_9ACTN|nr:hypothetical protein [Paraconexibacter antarcticus]UTI65730.1 hypothetical protein NBH00_05830 [Paraconexibacter antarcticus]